MQLGLCGQTSNIPQADSSLTYLRPDGLWYCCLCAVGTYPVPFAQAVQSLSVLLGSSQIPHLRKAWWWPSLPLFMIVARKDHLFSTVLKADTMSIWPLTFPQCHLETLYSKTPSKRVWLQRNSSIKSLSQTITSWHNLSQIWVTCFRVGNIPYGGHPYNPGEQSSILNTKPHLGKRRFSGMLVT